jgi:hypothetical protein
MAAQAYTQLSYPLTDFVASGGVVNIDLLQQTLKDATLTVTVQGASKSTAVVNIMLVGDPSAADLTTIDGIVATHTGAAFSPTLQRVVVDAEASSDTGTEDVRATLSTGPLPKGTYSLTWYCELSLTSASTTAGVRGLMYYTRSGAARTELSQTNVGVSYWVPLAGGVSEDVVDGGSYVFELAYLRFGAAGNAARIRRARISWVRISD